MQNKPNENINDSPPTSLNSDASVPLVSLHTHTDLSRCAKPDMTFEAAVAFAIEHGYHTLAFSDHVHPAEIIDWPAHAQRLRQYKSLRDEANWPVRVLIGGEFEVQSKGAMVECDEILEICEYTVVAPNHYHVAWVDCVGTTCAEVAAHELDCFETALNWPHTNILAHPYVGKIQKPEHEPNGMWEATDKGRVKALIELAKERGVALEIQPAFWYHPKRAGRIAELIDLWLDGGGLVSLGSDAHTLATLHIWAERYGEIIERFNLCPEKVWLPPFIDKGKKR
ncbi:MAG: PHP domain-containing protein [Candidatus Latescibacteria bacterium]|nr:PHP domain-containing protein [Candidatus Latescibacterota bacterium]MBT5829154.1 PHP domain-containing protein [Candidatus Latescibacterota bacterium]